MRLVIRLALAALAAAPASLAAQAFDSVVFHGLRWRNVIPTRGGRATVAVGVPGNQMVYYMGAAGGGLWKSENAGGRWRNVSDGYFKSGSIGDIAVFDGNPSIVYVGTGEAPVRGQMSSYGDGVYKSTDAGRTWAHIGLEKTRQISRVVVHPTDPNVVYVAAQGSRWASSDDRGIYRSVDGGATWKRVLFVSPNAGASELVMDPSNPKVLYATFWDLLRTPWAVRSGGPGSGVWKTTDGGDTWIQLKTGLPSLMGRIGLAIAPSSASRLYAIVEADS
ncbi:MAG TPA: glycosyl hydrolase, partial [Gemmatimonadaceae bacterium]